MKRLIITSFIALASLSCKKETQLSNDLIGDWHSTDHVWQLPIRNLIGDGKQIRFLETNEAGSRHLTMFAGDSIYKFKVLAISAHNLEMNYIKEKQDLHFVRWQAPKGN